MDGFVFYQDIPALEITKHKITVIGLAELGRKVFEIVYQFLLVVRQLKGIQKIIFEIKQVT